MAAYEYIALLETGRKQKGTIQAESERHARAQLRSKNLTPTKLKEISDSIKSDRKNLFKSNSLNLTQVSLLSRQLGSMLTAGLTLDDALASTAEQAEDKRVQSIVAGIRNKIQEGESFAAALKCFPNAFSEIYCATVNAAEQSGSLDSVISYLADHTENQAEFKQKISSALIYPMIIIVVALGVITGLMIFIIPDIISVFSDTGQELPAITQALIFFNQFLIKYWLFIPLAALILVLLSTKAMTYPAIEHSVHKLLFKVPGVGKVIQLVNSASFCKTLSTLLDNGVPLSEALDHTKTVIPNKYFCTALTKSLKEVKEGKDLSGALKNTQVFPALVIHLTHSGEISGELGAMLARAATLQERDLKRKISTFITLFEPLTLVLMGAIVLIIVLAVILPILNMNQLIT